jgi:hypothetical protein
MFSFSRVIMTASRSRSLEPIKHIDIGGIANDNGQLGAAILRQPAGQLLLEDRPFVPPDAVALEGNQRSL